MPLLPLVGWTWRELVRWPWFWLGAAGVGALGLVANAFRPLGATTGALDVGDLHRELAFLAVLAGAVAGMQTVRGGSILLAPLGRARRLAVEIVVGGSASAAFLVGALGPLVLVTRGQGFPPAGLVTGVLLAHLHSVAASSILLRVPLRPAGQVALLVALVWVLPAALAQEDRAAGWVAWLFGAARHLSPEPAALESWGMAPGPRPVLALLLAALLLDPPSPQHALRHPR